MGLSSTGCFTVLLGVLWELDRKGFKLLWLLQGTSRSHVSAAARGGVITIASAWMDSTSHWITCMSSMLASTGTDKLLSELTKGAGPSVKWKIKYKNTCKKTRLEVDVEIYTSPAEQHWSLVSDNDFIFSRRSPGPSYNFWNREMWRIVLNDSLAIILYTIYRVYIFYYFL